MASSSPPLVPFHPPVAAEMMDESLARLSLRSSLAAPARSSATAFASASSATSSEEDLSGERDRERVNAASIAAKELMRHLMPPPAMGMPIGAGQSSGPMAAGARRTFSITETPSNSPSAPGGGKFAPPSKRHHRSVSEDSTSAAYYGSIHINEQPIAEEDLTDDQDLSFLVGQIEVTEPSFMESRRGQMPYIM